MAGKTRSVDMMLVNGAFVFTDLPGLPSRDHQVERIWHSEWRPLVDAYLREAPDLRAMIYVHDIRWKVAPLVRDFLRDVQATGVPVLLVLSKDDRIALDARKTDKEHELRRRVWLPHPSHAHTARALPIYCRQFWCELALATRAPSTCYRIWTIHVVCPVARTLQALQ